jgi:ribonuclease G
MLRQLIINENIHETRVALLEDGTIVELFIERGDDSEITGNVYKGIVQRVLPGMQAAFVDIGLDQAAFIHVGDINGHPHDGCAAAPIADPEIVPTEIDEPAVNLASATETATEVRRPIEELLFEGQQILVHVIKSPLGHKGPRATTYISLPGRFLVLMPHSDHVGISRKIEDETERQRLKEAVNKLRDDQCGYIVRTAAEGAAPEKLADEMRFLRSLWESIQQKFKTVSAPARLHKELNVSLRAVRDLLTNEAEKVVTDSQNVYDSVLSFLSTYMPTLKDSITLYQGPEPLFDVYNLEGDITRTLKRKVWLKSGGYVVIEQTEALCAIDVNTGRYVGKHNLDETILKTNLEAVKEIAYQLRLRDISGIIIIDFIDMEKKANQIKVYNALKERLRLDRSKTHVLPISELGLVQMTRKRVRQPLTTLMSEPCFYCEGEGHLLSRRSICYAIYREVLREAWDLPGNGITLRVNPEIAELLYHEEQRLIDSLERRVGKKIEIYPNEKYHLEQFDLFEVLDIDKSKSF